MVQRQRTQHGFRIPTQCGKSGFNSEFFINGTALQVHFPMVQPTHCCRVDFDGRWLDLCHVLCLCRHLGPYGQTCGTDSQKDFNHGHWGNLYLSRCPILSHVLLAFIDSLFGLLCGDFPLYLPRSSLFHEEIRLFQLKCQLYHWFNLPIVSPCFATFGNFNW